MAVVLTAVGMFLYFQFKADLDNTLDRGLRSRAGDVSALVQQADAGLREAGGSPLTDQGESFAQIVSRDGRVLDATPQLRQRPLVVGKDLRRAAGGTIIVERDSTIRPGESARLLATPVQAQDQRLVVVVGASLKENENALRSLALLLLIGGPIALVFASLAGYGVASAALRPVEAMRRKAAEITEHQPGERLPVPPAEDEIARLGDTLNAMVDRLEAALARERTFVSDASHELRTPLAILKAEVELALRRGRSADDLYQALSSVAEETDRLVQLAEDLLLIARSDDGHLLIRRASVAPAELFEALEERFGRRVTETGRSMTAEAPAALRLNADLLRLEQALGNMIDNALRHGEGTIQLAATTRDGCVELHVRDEGAGFSPKFVGEAFERFARADDARARGGTGLGLAIVRAIAEAHGGEAFAANARAGGADVWIELPARTSPTSTEGLA